MAVHSVLLQAFVAALPEARRTALHDDEAAVDGLLLGVRSACHDAWPQIRLSDSDFGAHLARVVPPEGSLLDALSKLRLDDLAHAGRGVGEASGCNRWSVSSVRLAATQP